MAADLARPEGSNGGGDGRIRALNRAVVDREWANVVRLLEAHWTHFFNTHLTGMLDALTALPPEVMAENPRLKIGREYLVHTLSAGRKTRVFRDVVSMGEARTPMDRFAEFTANSVALRGAGRFAEASKVIGEANELLGTLQGAELRDVAHGLPELQYHWGVTQELAGHYTAALREYSSSYDHAVMTGHRMMRAMSAASAAWVHVLAGRIPSAQDWLSRIPDPEPGDWWADRPPAPALFSRAFLAIDALDLVEAREVVESIDIRPSMEHWATYQLVRSVVARYLGRERAQLTELEAFVADIPLQQTTSGANAALLALSKHILFAGLGQSADARRVLHDDAVRRSGSLLKHLVTIVEARWLAQEGQLEPARRLVVPLVTRANAYPRALIPALFIAGAAYRAAGNTATGNQYILDALHLAPAHGPLYNMVPDKRRVLEAMVDEGVLDASILDTVPEEPAPPSTNPFAVLTPREHEALTHAVIGGTVERIARAMFVSPNTVKTQLRSIYRKLGVSSRAELIDLAQRHGYRTKP